MALKTYADWEDAVRVAQVTYDHSQAKMVTKTKTVRKSRKMAFLSVLSLTKGGVSSKQSINKHPTSPPKRIKQRVNKSAGKMCVKQGSACCIQIIIDTPLVSTVCLQLPSSTSILAVKELLQDRLGISPEKQHLCTKRGFELCDALSLADHSIQQNANIELRLVSGLMGGTRKQKDKAEQRSPDFSSKERIPDHGRQDDTQQDPTAPDEQPSSCTSNTWENTVMQGHSEGITFGEVHSRTNVYALPITACVSRDDRIDDYLTTAVIDTLKLLASQSGVNDVKKMFNDVLEACAGEMYRVEFGPLRFITHVESRAGLEKLWAMFSTGELAQKLTKVLITDELTTEEKSSIVIQVEILREHYEEGCQFFEELPEETTSADQPVHMSEWSKYDVKHWLKTIGVSDVVIDKVFDEAIDGRVLILYTSNDLQEDFNMNKRDLRLILYKREALKRQPKLSPNPKEKEVVEYKAERALVQVHPIQTSPSPSDTKTNQTVTDMPELSVRPKIPKSKAISLLKRGHLETKHTQPVQRLHQNIAKVPNVQDDPLNPAKGFELSLDLPSEYKGAHVSPQRLLTAKSGQDPLEVTQKMMELISLAPQPSTDNQQQDVAFMILGKSRAQEQGSNPSLQVNYPEQYRDENGKLTPGDHEASSISPTTLDASPRTNVEFDDAQIHDDKNSDKVKEQARDQGTPSQACRNAASSSKFALPVTKFSQSDEAKVRLLLTGDERGELSQSLYSVLVANKLDAPSEPTESRIDIIAQQFEFIKSIKWTSVLDFDSQSLSDGLCKLYHENRMVTLQQPDLFKNIESEEDLRTSIGFPEKTLWLFANGREDNPTIESPPMDLQEWNKERSRDVEASISFFSQPSVIPKGRAAIVFLLLSDQDLGIVCDIFRKMSSSFQGIQNITCIAEDESVYAQFVKGVEKWFSKAEIDERSVVGLKWQDINRIVMRMNGVNKIEAYELPTHIPEKCFLSEKQKDEWNDITVVCKNECENTDMNESNPGYRRFAEKKELNFYRGAKVDWWNFAIGEKEMNLHRRCGHVLKRKGFGDVLRKVRKPLDSSNTEDSLIVTVTLLHQPGAGGSTLARHILWELRQEFRCIVVNTVTGNTASQIMEVRRHGYEKGCNQKIPAVCVLVDDLDDVELLDLIDEVKEVSRDIQLDGGAVCVVLRCKRCAEPETLTDGERRELYIALTQKLDAREKEWLERKYRELQLKEKELQSTEYKPEHLLAFMVMLKEFDKDYITHVVSEILGGISENEFKLIKLCAFLNSYRPEAAIPISCCDSMMDRKILVSGRTRVHSRPWEGSVSSSFKIMVVVENNELRIFHERIAKETLEQIQMVTNQSLTEVALEFLNCELFSSWSYSKETLVKATHDLLVRRKRIRFGDDTETDFAVIIQDIYENHGPEKAIEILQVGFEKLEDAFIAQQLARLCLKEHNIGMAHIYADKAVTLEPQNCYFVDTKGRIYKTEMWDIVSKRMEEQQVIDDKECDKLLSLAYHAMDAFHKTYDVSKKGREIEYTGLYAEVDVAFRLLQVIYTCVEPFRTKGGQKYLQEYLLQLINPSDPSYPKLSEDCHGRIMTLKNRIDSVLNLLDDTSTFCKGDPTNEQQKLDEMKDRLKEYFRIYERYYGEPKPIQQNRYRNPRSLAESRRRQVKQASCGTFREIFDLARNKGLQKLKESYKLLLENSDQYNFFDLKHLVCIHLALSSAGEQLLPADEVYQQFVRPLNAKDHRKTDCWPPFFMMMFLWPIEDVTSERRDSCDLTFYIDELRERFSGAENFRKGLTSEKRPPRFQTRARTHFFLGQGTDLQVFAHINELHTTPGKIDGADSEDDFWSSDLVRSRLARLEGTLLNPTSLVHLSKKGKINIKLAAPFKRQVPSQEIVTFYLGFTWDGPVAYDIKVKGKESRDGTAPRFHQAYPSLNVPSEKSKTSLSRKLSKIDKLREECQKLRGKLEGVKASSKHHVKVKTKEGCVWKPTKDAIQLYKRQLEEKNDELRRALMEDTSSTEDF
ncbi:sterile alpha motif domain-containing protein 9-like isoform X2 [Acanthaster planci]|uniref:Sterile alpha motif domain-containing protein 9-like isoform X2 n=1 Tax=Acanthaster planci TaxID=133434 RepID=A0A8B7ZYH9_ACAPL|nr:sterile alpha motif domain-containing protein 9-like isoform X2 [Acanthaster planci]